MSELARLTKCCLYLSKEFPQLDKEKNLNYVKKLIGNYNDNEIEIPEMIDFKVNLKLKKYEQKRIKEDENFYFNSSSLKALITNVYTCMICKINVCLIGKTGIGKTNFTRAFSKIFRQKDETSLYDILFSFNRESTIENLYGTFAFEGGKTVIVEGPLYKAIDKGLIFIADEFNLAEESIIQSFINILEIANQSSKVLIPGINKTIPYNKNCFIIICQNDSNTLERRILPNSIKKKIRIFQYPEPTYKDINEFSQNIISNELDDDNEENFNLAYKLSQIMESLNQKEFVDIGRWSMRDIRKILRRINLQRTSSKDEYKNIKDIHQILIYIFSGIPKNKVEKILGEIISLIKKPFFLNDSDVNELESMIKSKAKIEKTEKGTYIMKGECGKRITGNFDEMNNELYSFLDSLFYASFADIKEPLLICGPSGYKTFLAKKISFNSKVINLYPETSLSQLLGSTHIRENINAKKYYLKEILSICNNNEFTKMEKLLEKYLSEQSNKSKNTLSSSRTKRISNNFNFKQSNFKEEIETIIKKSLKDKGDIGEVLKRLEQNLFSPCENNSGKENFFGNFTSFFQAGILIQNILEQKYIILKGIDHISPNILERFNDLLNYSPKISLNEDLYNTFTNDKKEIQNFYENFRIIAISSIKNINNFSETSRSRFTLISTSRYTKEEKPFLIKKICDNCPLGFYSFLEKFDIIYKEELSFKIINKILTIFKKLNEKDKKEERNMILAIYYSLIPFLQKDEINSIINILKQIFISEEMYFFIKDNEFIRFEFSQENREENENVFKISANDISSYSTGLSIIRPDKDKDYYEDTDEMKLEFHESFNNLLEIIHFAISIHFPLIIEGETGCGKKTAIYYISQVLGFHLINFQITELTTLDDLFGKEVIKTDDENLFIIEKTDFYNAVIENDENEENKEVNYNETNSIIFLENIEQASPSILEALIPFFDKSISKFLLPFGQEGKMKKYNIILSYDPSRINSSFQNFFPPQIYNNSLIFKMQNPSTNDYYSIFNKMTYDKEYSNEKNNRIILR